MLALGKVGTYSQNNLSFPDVNQLLRKLHIHICICYIRLKKISICRRISLKLFLKKHKRKESTLISSMKKSDGSQLPPCSSVLKEKINRTEYVTGVWLSSAFLSSPDRSPVDYEWIIQYQKYYVKWFDVIQA